MARTARICLTVAGLLAALVAPHAAAETRGDIARDLVTHHAVPGYEAFADKAATLDQRARAFCTDEAEAGLEALRTAHEAAFLAWQRVQHIRFGPVMQADRYYRIEYWPDKHGQGGRQLRKLLASDDIAGLTPERLADKSVALQGFPALERVLFGDDPAGLCPFLTAITGNLARMADRTAAAWDETAAPEGDEAVERTLKDFFQSFIDQIQFIRLSKLGAPLGETPRNANPRAAEAWRSGLSLAAVKANLDGLQEAFAGDEETGVAGLGAALSRDEADADYRRSVERALRYASSFIDDHPALLTDDLTSEEGRESVAFLMLHLEGVRERAAGALGDALGIGLGFNAMDGD